MEPPEIAAQEQTPAGGEWGWEPFSWQAPENVTAFLDDMAHSTTCLTLHQPGLDSYLLPREMISHVETERMRNLGWESQLQQDWLDWANRHIAEQIDRRDEGAFQHRIITADATLRAITGVQPDWIREVGERIGKYSKKTAVGFVPGTRWKDVDYWVRRLTRFAAWDKLCVIDETAAMIRPHHHQYLVTHNARMVRHLRRSLETNVVPCVGYAFPEYKQFGLGTMRESARHATDFLKDLSRTACEKAWSWQREASQSQ